MNKAVFLDRDGTINVETGYLYKIDEFEFLPRALEGMKMLYDVGFLLIIVTNQSGIARGLYSEKDFIKLTEHVNERCKEYGIQITDTFYCPHFPYSKIEKYRKECNCRKPKIGMFMRAVNMYDIDLSSSYAIGDKMRDLSICKDSKCQGFLINSQENPQDMGVNIRRVASLYEASQIILKEIESETEL